MCDSHASDDFCDTTTNLGVISAHARLQILNDAAGSPVALSAIVGGRTGAQHTAARHRLTTLSEGTTDAGAGLSAGRAFYASFGEVRVHADGIYWLRGEGQTEIGPADEISSAVAAEWSIGQLGWLGAVSNGFWRLGGEDLSALDLNEPDVWGRLDATELKAGLKGGVRINQATSLHASVLRTVYARNNPNDTLAVGFGVNFWRPDPDAGW